MGEKRESFYRERLVRNEKKSHWAIYRKTRSSMDWEVSKGVELWFSIDGTIEELSRGVHSKVTSMDWKAIERTKTSSMDQEAIETNS